jgi:hypothetical protein
LLLLAYSFIMVHEGYPCVFWYDYYNNGLARPFTPNGIDVFAAGPVLAYDVGSEFLAFKWSGTSVNVWSAA